MQTLYRRNSCITRKTFYLFTCKKQSRKMDKLDGKLKTCETSEKNADLTSSEEASVVIDDRLSTDLLTFQQNVDWNRLDEKAKCIHRKHLEALQSKQETYKDPETGYKVFTRLAHLKRGQCCGSACRHCPYGQVAAPENRKKKFNTAFYF